MDSGKDVDICLYTIDILSRGGGTARPSTLFNPHKPDPQSRALCGVVCTLSVVNITFISRSIVSMFNLFLDFSCFYMYLIHEYNIGFNGLTLLYCQLLQL